MTRRINEIELISQTIQRGVIERYTLRFDGNAALTLDIHGIENLRVHFSRRKSSTYLYKTVCKSRLPVIDMGDDREVTD